MTADAAFWNDLAEKYARKPVENPDAFEKKIAITRARMGSSDVILDVGCGTGSLALRLADRGAHVHGLDLSREMVRIARDKAVAAGVDNVTFHTGAFDDGVTTFEPESLDGICAYSILHLVEDMPAAVDRIYRLLKPGGFFVSSTVCLGETWIPYAAIIGVMRRFGKAPMVTSFSKQDLEDAIVSAGFVDVSHPDVGAKPTIAFVVATKPR